MSADECRAFVHAAVSHAMARDGSSGGCIRTVTIDETGVKRTFTPGNEVSLYWGPDWCPEQLHVHSVVEGQQLLSAAGRRQCSINVLM